MEERVGLLWHRLVTRAAERRFPEAAVPLSRTARSAGMLFRAAGGDPGVAVKACALTVNGARRRVLERIAGSGRKAELAYRDRDALYLPLAVDRYPEASLNRDLYLWLAALAACHEDSGAGWLADSQRATLRALALFPGMRARWQRLVAAELAVRPDPRRLPADEGRAEGALQAALRRPGSVAELPRARRPHAPLPLWLHPEPPRSASDAARGADPQAAGGGARRAADERRRAARRVDSPDGRNGFLMFFRAESLLSWAEYVKVNRPTEEDEAASPEAADDLDELAVARDGEAVAAKLRFDLDLPAEAHDDRPLGEGIALPEWDWRKGALVPDQVRLQPLLARDCGPAELRPDLRRPARRIRRQFEGLAGSRVWLKAQPDGAEADLDAWMEFAAERVAGQACAVPGLHKDCRRRSRDLACLLLADLSLSTDAWVSNAARVIDVIRDSLHLFAEALAATGDAFGIYGFSSLRRENVRFHVIKDFAERHGPAVRGRIDALKPGFYTRMGAAVRHASSLLARQGAAQKLLLLLTDGKPNDLDRYEGRYGIEDTRMAIHEARRMGLHPFCVTIDERAGDYLPHLFGQGGYVLIRKPADLPRELPLLYARMTA